MDFLRLINPRFWQQNAPTSLDWDKALNKALSEQGVIHAGRHTALIGPYEVRVSNWPYAFGCNYADPFAVRSVT